MIQFLANAALGKCTTFLAGGRARRLGFAYTREELIEAESMGALVLGRGSNVLIGDGGYDGDAVINRTCAREFGENECISDSGVLLSTLAREYAERGLGGLEWAYGLPGTVGGAAIGNAGAFGGCMADCVISVTAVRDGVRRVYSNEECGFAYRRSLIEGVVLGVRLKAEKSDPVAVKETSEANLRERRLRFPGGASAGSVFRAAGDMPAGKLIEAVGLKGYRLGGAQISDKHANFIVNRGGAASSDILILMNTAAAAVYDRYGVKLGREIRLYGEF